MSGNVREDGVITAAGLGQKCIPTKEKNQQFKKIKHIPANQIDAMRLGGNDNARTFFRKHGQTDLHGKIEKKYTSKAAKLYKTELLKMVDAAASQRGEATSSSENGDATTATSDLLNNLEVSSQAEQDALAREKIAEARAAHAQPAQSKAKLASQLPGASKLATATTNGNGASATPVLRKPAGSTSANPKLFLKKKTSSSVGSSKLRVNKLTTSSSNVSSNGSSGVSAKDFDDFDAAQQAEQEAAAEALVRQAEQEAAAQLQAQEAAKQAEAEAAAAAAAPKASSMDTSVAKLKAMNQDFFANM